MGIQVAYDPMDQLLADKALGEVHITTPNKYHFEQVKQTLKAGLHVMCEKPLSMDSVESSELVKIAADSGRFAGVNYNIRYYPLNIEAKHRAAQIGRIHEVSGGYVQDWLLEKADYNWRVLSDVSGQLRAIGDIGTHWLDLVTFITGKRIRSVCADLYTIHPVRQRPVGEVHTFSNVDAGELEDVAIDTEDGGHVLIRFEDGSRGALRVSQVAAGRKNRVYYEICGDTETIAWDGEMPNRLWIGRRGAMNQELIKDPSVQSPEANFVTDYPGGHAEGFPDSHKQCFRSFYDAIESRSPLLPFPSFEDGHREMRLCDAILKSARAGAWVDIAE
jgi:predicted dehydrogenase